MPRPKQFDPDAALDRAVEVFWTHGYDGTSVQTLVDGLGISRSSLYDTFGDKDRLFLAALDRYRSRQTRALRDALGTGQPALAALRAFFHEVAARAASASGPAGCFMANAAAERAHCCGATAKRVDINRQHMAETLREAVARAQAEGDVPAAHDPAAAAQHLLVVAYGLNAAAQAGADADALHAAAHAALGALA